MNEEWRDKLKQWLRSQGLSQNEFSRRYKISQPYINQLINGSRVPGPKTAFYLEKITEGKVKKEEMRPDLWGEHNENEN